MTAEQSSPNDGGETVRPGGWVDGIGWVARLCDLDAYDTAHETEEGPQEADLVQMWTAHDRLRQVVIVKAWAGGPTPHASQAPAWAAGYQIGFADGQTPTPPAPVPPEPSGGIAPDRLPDGVYRSEDTFWMVAHWWDDVPAGWTRRSDADPTHEVFAVVPSRRCQFHPENPVTTEIAGRVLVCDVCAADPELIAHAESDWR